MSGYLSEKVNDLNSGRVGKPIPRGFRLGRCTSPSQLSSHLEESIIGQKGAIDAVVRALTIAAAGIRDPHRPIASLLFAGPTGVGKTELARLLAAEITGSPDKLCRIDMGSLAQEHYSASLAGAPPGYAGSKEQFTLFDRELVEGNSSRPGIVLFDEVEKAHSTVLRSLLQILDTGILHLTSGTSTISFRNSIILLTSNLGSTEFASQIRTPERRLLSRLIVKLKGLPNTPKTVDGTVVDAIERFFDPELFNRFDEVVLFNNLDREASRSIVEIELEQLRRQLARLGISWAPDHAVTDHLATVGFDQIYGARNLKRTIRTELHAPIAFAITNSKLDERPLEITTTVSGNTIYASSRY